MSCCFRARREYEVKASGEGNKLIKFPVKASGEDRLLSKDEAIKYSNENLKETITAELEKEESFGKGNIDEFKFVADYPAPYIFAKLAEKAYKDYDEKYEQDLPDGWKLLTTANNDETSNGYFGVAYWNLKQQQVIIAHRGTKINSCVFCYTDIEGIVKNKYVAQIDSACTFTDWITKALNKLNEENQTNFQLCFTGHSLGGWLAQITTFTAKYLTIINDDNVPKFETTNEKGFHAHTVVFDSPGCKDMLDKLQDNFPRYSHELFSIADLDITSYLSAPNLINTRNKHVGTIYRIFVALSDMNCIQKYTAMYNLETHKMKRILKTFQDKDVQIKQVQDWPISTGLGGKEFKNFFKWAKHFNNYDPDLESESYRSQIRYQVKDVEDNISNINIFTQTELSILDQYQRLRDLKYNLKLQDLFSDIKDENSKKEITERLQFFKIESGRIRCQNKEELRKLIPCVKSLWCYIDKIQSKMNETLTMKAIIDSKYSDHRELVKTKLQHFTDDKELKALINNFKQVSLVSVEENISFGLARIYKAYTENTTRDETKDFVLNVERIFDLKNQFYFNQTMTDFVEALIKDRSLILVQCTLNFNDEHQKKFLDDFLVVLKRLEDQSETKIILIFQSSSKTQELQRDLEMRNLMPPKWDNLSNEFQEKLLKKPLIVFQEQKGTSLKEIIRDNNEEYSKIVSDQKILLALINDEEIVINIESCDKKSPISQYYVKRTFTYQIEIKTNIYTKGEMEDLFLISGTDKEHLKSLGLAEDKIRLFQENDPVKNNPTKFIIAEDHQAHFNFKQLCTEYPNFNIHWLKSGGGKQIWQQTHGSILNLKQYLEQGENHTHSYSEIDLLTKNKNVIIISDTAGMGKSTVLTFLLQEIKKQYPDSLVLRIDLNMHTKQLDTLKEHGSFKGGDIKETFEKAIQFLAESVFKIPDPSKQFLFQFYCQLNIGNMIVMLDGFDEISPDYKNEVIDLIQALRNGAIKQIFITTRPNMQGELENEFQQFAHALKPFSEEDQQKFLTEFWQKSLNHYAKINKDQFKTYAGALIKLLAESISDKEASFTGIPLQIRMLAEAFQEKFDRFYNSNETVPKLPENLDLIDLYERFLKDKHEIYQKEKNGLDLTKTGNKEQNKEFYSKFIREHEIMALHALFNEEEFEQHFQEKKEKLSTLMNDIKEGKINYGLIDRVINDKPQFIHRTFAEYLVARYLVDNLENHTLAEFVLQQILIKSTYQIIRIFFNGLLTEILSQTRISECTLINYGEEIRKLWLKNDKHLYNDEGNSIFHVAAEEDNENIAGLLLTSLEKQGDLKLSIIDEVTHIKFTALCLAAKRGHLKISKCLVENGAYVNWTNENSETVLHWAARSGNLELVKYLVEKGAHVNAIDSYNMTVLHWVTEYRNLELMKYLVERGVDVHAKDNFDRTVLDWAAESGLELPKDLFEEGAGVNG